MTINSILALLFFGFVAIAWIVLNFSTKGYQVYEHRFTSQATHRLESMFLFFDYKKLFFINLLGLLLAPIVVYWLTGSLFYVVLTLIVALAWPKVLVKFLNFKRRNRINEDLPDALAQMSGSMRSGATFSGAMEVMVGETTGPIKQEFDLVLREQKVGLKPEEALENLAERVNSEDVDLLVTAVLIARDVGGNLAETFERLSLMLRRKNEMERKIKALTAQGKLQGIVVSLLPFGIMFALHFVEPESIGPMFHSALGWLFISVIIILEILGGLMIKKIVTIDV